MGRHKHKIDDGRVPCVRVVGGELDDLVEREEI